MAAAGVAFDGPQGAEVADVVGQILSAAVSFGVSARENSAKRQNSVQVRRRIRASMRKNIYILLE